MALKGTIEGTTSNKWIDVKIEWSATQSVAKNCSYITAKVYYIRTNTGYETHGNWRGEITIDGDSESIVKEVWINENGWTEAGSFKKTVYHNADGTKSTTISATGKINNTSLDSTSVSGSITLDRIARSITLSSAPNFTDEDNPVITYSNPAGNGASTLQACISFDKVADNIPYRDIPKTGSSYIFNLTDAERKTLREYLKTATSGTVYFYIKALIGGETFYSSQEKTLTIVNANPTITASVKDIDDGTYFLTGDRNTFVKYHSVAEVSAGATAKKEAVIMNTKVQCGAKSINASEGVLRNVEDNKFIFTTTDSRGYTASTTIETKFIDYIKLTCNLTATPPTTEGKMTFTISGNFYNGSFGLSNNSLSLYYRYKLDDGYFTGWQEATYELSGNSYSVSYTLENLDYQKHYTFQAKATDALENIETPEINITGTPIFSWGETEFDFNVPVNFNKDFILNDEKGSNLAAAVKALSTTFSLPTTGTASSGYSNFEVSNAILIGNMLRCYFTATRATNFADGNIANEIIGNMSINHGGKVKSMYNVGFASAGGGVFGSLTTTNAANSETVLSFDIQVSATSSTGNQINAYFIVPVSLNLEAY